MTTKNGRWLGARKSSLEARKNTGVVRKTFVYYGRENKCVTLLERRLPKLDNPWGQEGTAKEKEKKTQLISTQDTTYSPEKAGHRQQKMVVKTVQLRHCPIPAPLNK